MNTTIKIGTTILLAGGIAFFVGLGGMMFANNDKEMVSMPIKGCWTRMEGSNHKVREHFYCRFEDQRVNENVDILYHPMAYKEMSSYPVGTKFSVEAESMTHKKSMNIFVPTFLIGLLCVIAGFIAVAAGGNKRW